MNHMDGWMSRGMGGGVWFWSVMAILIVAVIVLLIKTVIKK